MPAARAGAAAAPAGSRTASCRFEWSCRKTPKPRLPVVRQVGVQRRVVQRRHHLGHRLLRVRAGDHRRPGFLLRRLELRDEVLPLDRQLLVGPRHLDLLRVQVGPVLADHRHAHGEAAAHGLGDRLLDRHLRLRRLRSSSLQQLAAGARSRRTPGPVVAGAPQGQQLLARLQRPLRRRDHVRHLDRQLLRRPDRSTCSGSSAVTVLPKRSWVSSFGPVQPDRPASTDALAVPVASVVTPCSTPPRPAARSSGSTGSGFGRFAAASPASTPPRRGIGYVVRGPPAGRVRPSPAASAGTPSARPRPSGLRRPASSCGP